MYNVYFYQDENGNQPVKEYLDELEEKSAKSKDARIKYNKIDQYIGILMGCGTAAGEPYIKHLDGEIEKAKRLMENFKERSQKKDGE
ncbi:MAG: hypothetical protein LUE87_09760 [Lachnospiraceae bacterium]|nr:hypothetical protein [Lachnospiraceae bacterium]